MIHVDTSVLVDGLTADQPAAADLDRAVRSGERMAVSALALFEWLRGPRRAAELTVQNTLLPPEAVVPFDAASAARAAAIYRSIRSPRGREIDIAIAACAIEHGAALWTRNPADFRDIPGLKLYTPPRP